MNRLSTCPSCDGFVPFRADQCPHCGEEMNLSTAGKLVRAAVAVTIGGAFAATLMACYGGAIPQYDAGPDGTPNDAPAGETTVPSEAGSTNP